MAHFENQQASHRHSLNILELINGYDSFLDNLKVIADMGAGNGQDINWWATLMDKEDPPAPRDYLCFAVDKNTRIFDKDIATLPNIKIIEADFEQPRIVPRKIDLMWSHNSFQYAINPLQTLKNWNEMMNVNGMLVITVPQTYGYSYNRLVNRTYNHAFYSYTPTNLIYMLASNGFDCKDFYMCKNTEDPWLTIATYKSDIPPFDLRTVTWDELYAANLIHPSIFRSYTKYGHVRQEDIIVKWLNGNWTELKD